MCSSTVWWLCILPGEICHGSGQAKNSSTHYSRHIMEGGVPPFGFPARSHRQQVIQLAIVIRILSTSEYNKQDEISLNI